MKKWLTGILIVAIVMIALLYVLIPGNIVIKKAVTVNVAPLAISRILIENRNWNKGWPGDDSTIIKKDAGQSVYFNGNSYSVTDWKYRSIILAIHRDDDMIATASLNIIPISKDSVKLDWEAIMPASNNPFSRFNSYRESKQIENDVEKMLYKMASWFSKKTNVYKIEIRRESVKDTALLSTYHSGNGYPKPELIYSMIGQLKQYIASRQAVVTGYPMLNIYTKDSITYLTKVALPVDKRLPDSGTMTYKWMLPGGNILVSDVKGDQRAIDKAFEQIEYYLADYGLQSPAIPFLSLITDRMQEKDPSKWITRIYYPVMDL